MPGSTRTDRPAPTRSSHRGSATKDSGAAWLDPNKIPPWAYMLMLLGGGSTIGGVQLFNRHDYSEDIARIEEKADKIDQKVDDLTDKLTDLRIAIARYHANNPGNSIP